MSDSAHCPHCGGELPEPDTGEQTAIAFCPSCGRRVEGWRTGFRATIGGANAPATAPGGEEPTRALAPSASLLRAAIAAEPVQVEKNDTVAATPPKKRSSPFALLGMIVGALAIAIGALLLLGKPHRPPATIVRPAPTIVPQVDVASPDAATVAVAPPLVAPPPPDKTPPRPEKSPPPLAKVEPVGKTPAKTPPVKVATGGLPHKAGRTDSRQLNPGEQSGQSGTSLPTGSAPPMVPPPSPPPLVSASSGRKDPEQAAQTPQQLAEARHDEGASQTDAQNVRFVVQSHIGQVQACYSRAFKDSAPGGRVDIAFLIGANGRATKVRTDVNATKSTVLSSCLEHLIEGWQFVRPTGGTLELIYPFVFTPGA